MSGLKDVFQNFAKFGATGADGNSIKLTQIDKWFKQAGIFDKTLTTTDTGITFGKLFKQAKSISFQQFEQFIKDLANQKKKDPNNLIQKLIQCGLPGVNGATTMSKTGAVDRLTDVSQYTGSHKERFDSSGKGKGIAGRADVQTSDGYVKGYKGKDTYDKKK